MSAPATLAAVAVSLTALGYLVASDPKRRRAFRRPAPGTRHGNAAWALALLPGVVVPFSSGAAGFFVWLGAVTVAGWVLAATSPDRTDTARRLLGDAASRLQDRLEPMGATAGRIWDAARLGATSGLSRVAQAAQPSDLELRIRQLESEVAELRRELSRAAPPAPGAADGDVVVELARPGGRR